MSARNLAALLVAAAMTALPARAVETASFLNIGIGGRALGMGGAYTALADDANSIYWNPAGLAAVDRHEVTVSHSELALNTHLDFLAYAQATRFATFAGAATYLTQSSIEGRDAAGHLTATYTASDFAGSLAAGRKTDWADFGAAVKIVQSHIASAQAQTVALDVGAKRSFGRLGVGAALRNMGPGMKFDSETDSLPLRLAFGAAFKFPAGHALSAEWTNAPRAGGNDFGFGGEYQTIKGVFLRAGYTTQTAISGGSSFDAARGLTLGVGLRGGRWLLDYAAIPMGELGSTHRFTLGARW